VLADGGNPSVGGYLFRQALAGGARAAARPVAGLAVGQRADLLALDPDHPDLYGKRGDAVLDSLIFCNHGASPIRDVLCGGRWVIRERRHAAEAAIGQSYRAALRALLDEESP
jgi:formimidoylglutamate deiminase